MVRIADTMGRNEPQGTIEIPDRGGVRHWVEHTGKGIDFDGPKERDRQPGRVFQKLRAVWKLAGGAARRLGCEGRLATGSKELPARPLVVAMLVREVRYATPTWYRRIAALRSSVVIGLSPLWIDLRVLCIKVHKRWEANDV